MAKPQLINIESPFIENLLRNLDSTLEVKTAVTPAKHTFDLLLNSPSFHEKYTPIHTKFEEILNKYYKQYPDDFESYIKHYDVIKEQIKPK